MQKRTVYILSAEEMEEAVKMYLGLKMSISEVEFASTGGFPHTSYEILVIQNV